MEHLTLYASNGTKDDGKKKCRAFQRSLSQQPIQIEGGRGEMWSLSLITMETVPPLSVEDIRVSWDTYLNVNKLYMQRALRIKSLVLSDYMHVLSFSYTVTQWFHQIGVFFLIIIFLFSNIMDICLIFINLYYQNLIHR